MNTVIIKKTSYDDWGMHVTFSHFAVENMEEAERSLQFLGFDWNDEATEFWMKNDRVNRADGSFEIAVADGDIKDAVKAAMVWDLRKSLEKTFFSLKDAINYLIDIYTFQFPFAMEMIKEVKEDVIEQSKKATEAFYNEMLSALN